MHSLCQQIVKSLSMLYKIKTLTLSTALLSSIHSIQVNNRKNKSIIADVPIWCKSCPIKSSLDFKNSNI